VRLNKPFSQSAIQSLSQSVKAFWGQSASLFIIRNWFVRQTFLISG